MGLFHQAVKTYDAMLPVIDFNDPERVPLPPVAHAIKKAGIEITLDTNGKFLSARARRVEEEKQKDGTYLKPEPRIVIPVREESLGRSSAPQKYPHYLTDYLLYMMPENKEAYEAYTSQLEDWANSPYGDPKLDAILAYVKGGTIIRDLVRERVLRPDKSGEIKAKDTKVNVCWIVNGLGADSGPCWTDRGLMDKLIRYHMERIAKDHKVGVCMVSGDTCVLANTHAKGVVPVHGNARLISSNSQTNNIFTYRGRFLDAEQALTVGYETSQKMHNALAWVIANQGVVFGKRTFVCWNPEGKKVPALTGFLNRMRATGQRAATPSDYKKQLQDSLLGWKAELPDDADVVFAIFDAATIGCLSILYYNEIPGNLYLERLYQWEDTCCVENMSPSLGNIARFAYGTVQKGKVEASDANYRRAVQKLILCRLNGDPFPVDIVRGLVRQADNMMLVSDESTGGRGSTERERLLQTTCSAIRKYRYDTKKEEWSMTLDRTCTDRSYLFGRLLAVAEHAERRTYDRDITREPNAIRFQRAFAQRPMNTWRNIHERLTPYFARLNPWSRAYYRDEIEEIQAMLPEGEELLNKPLADTYLLGYYHQRAELRRHKPHGQLVEILKKEEEVNNTADTAANNEEE